MQPVAGMEWSAHKCPERMLREVQPVLRGRSDLGNLIVVPTCQKAAMDLLGVG